MKTIRMRLVASRVGNAVALAGRDVRRMVLATAFLGVVGFTPVAASAADYVLPFTATPNAPGGQTGGAQGVMYIHVANGKSTVTLKVRNLYPNALYTVWTVFGHLALNPDGSVPAGHAPPQCPPQPPPYSTPPSSLCPQGWAGWANYPAEGHSVAPTAKIRSKFTDGMGLDPGATFLTNTHGDGEVTVTLDYDITSTDMNDGPPLGNKHSITQIVPAVPVCTTSDGETTCGPQTKNVNLNVTSTYLRRFVNEYPVGTRASTCANYDPSADPENSSYDPAASHGVDARLWQCVDPSTGMPRVPRFGFDHFRLANHVDDLTHGFVGGNGTDHLIDMVGLRACAYGVGPDASAKLPPLSPDGDVTVDDTCPTIGTTTSLK